MVEISQFLLIETGKTLCHTLHFKTVWAIVPAVPSCHQHLAKAPLWTEFFTRNSAVCFQNRTGEQTPEHRRKPQRKTFNKRETQHLDEDLNLVQERDERDAEPK